MMLFKHQQRKSVRLEKKTNRLQLNRFKNILLVVGILFIAANLRFSLTSVGPLIGMIRADIVISNGIAGLLTTFPLLSFAIFSIFAPKIVLRYDINYILMVSLIALTVGILFRSIFHVVALLGGTFILGSAIAMGNVLLPSLIKQKFPNKLEVMTGMYTTFMNLFGALASGLSVPISQELGLGWRKILASTALLAFITIIIWIPQLFFRNSPSTQQVTQRVNLWRSPLAWYVTLFMGIQSLLYFVMLSWLPEIFINQGMNSSKAGFMLAVVAVSLIA